MKMKASVLIVDDDPDIRDVLSLLLSEEYSVFTAADGMSAISTVKSNPSIDLIVLDVMMPGMSGFDACSEIRRISNAPILFLTAKSAENDRLSAYKSGGDDYLTKPFSHAELKAKISTLLRRYTEYRGKPDTSAAIDRLEIDGATRTVKVSGEPITLTDTEYSILDFLVRNRGKTITAVELYESVWQEKYLPSSGNTVMVHVLNLRRKIEENPSTPKIIRTVWGKGYQID